MGGFGYLWFGESEKKTQSNSILTFLPVRMTLNASPKAIFRTL